MTADEWQNIDNIRNQAIQQLAEVCAAMGLSWSATEKEFTIALPTLIVMKGGGGSVMTEMPTTRKSFDISTWGDIDVFGNQAEASAIPDDFQMPNYGEILEEGESPKGGYNEDDELNK